MSISYGQLTINGVVNSQMCDGFYWIQTQEGMMIAWYSHEEEVEDIETEQVYSGVWFIVDKSQTVYFSDEVTVLQGPLSPPLQNL